MNCSPFDLRDFLLQELSASERRQVESHVETCASCREELHRLRLTQTALSSLVDEEIPRRIAFVSDAVFEPSAWRRGWAAFWGSGARLIFASGAMLSIAIVTAPLLRRAPAAPAPSAPVQAISDAEIRARIDAGVTRAVADIEAQYRARTEKLVTDIEQRDRSERRLLTATYADDLDRAHREFQNYRRANEFASNAGEPK